MGVEAKNKHVGRAPPALGSGRGSREDSRATSYGVIGCLAVVTYVSGSWQLGAGMFTDLLPSRFLVCIESLTLSPCWLP